MTVLSEGATPDPERPMKNYGTPITENAFWAYGVTAGKVALVRCQTVQDAATERDRMKQSNASTVGLTTRKIAEMDMWKQCRTRGWKISIVRNFK
jgi:hypothetical protein